MIKYLSVLLFSLNLFANIQNNEVPSRLQWMHNSGYCGETSLIAAGLYFGQYLSQYDVRALIAKEQTKGSLLLGINDQEAAQKLHLSYEAWDTDDQENTEQFLIWLKQKVAAGNPVAIGVYANQSVFETGAEGDAEYDHIVSVITLHTQHAIHDPTYYGEDEIGFSDNGLFEPESTPFYYFASSFDSFPATRAQANLPTSPIYTLSNSGQNYGIAITGVADLHGDTLPIQIFTDYNYENPPIEKGSNQRPKSMPVLLIVTVSNVKPGIPYILYRYDNIEKVPESEFNAHASSASQQYPFQISLGSTYTRVEQIQSSDQAIYRCVQASAP
jgi:hypothetical protein